MRAALVQGSLALVIVTLFHALLRRHISHAFAHGLFLLVPIKTLAAAIFVAWPVAIAFSLPVPGFIYQVMGSHSEVARRTINDAPIELTASGNSSPEITDPSDNKNP
ncbi:MAG: hypothetical protein ACKO0V_19300 [bacterium]